MEKEERILSHTIEDMNISVRSMIHEINNLLFVITLCAEQAKTDPSKLVMLPEIVIRHCRYIKQVPEKWFFYEWQEKDERAELTLLDEVREVFSYFEFDLDKGDIRANFLIDPALRIFFSKIGFRSVLINLLKNSLEGLPHGTEIKIFGDIDNEDEEKILLIFSDNGPGIPIEKMANLFTFKSNESGRFSGRRGMGLAICRMILESEGGTIAIDKGGHTGVTFILKIPRHNQGVDRVKSDQYQISVDPSSKPASGVGTDLCI